MFLKKKNRLIRRSFYLTDTQVEKLKIIKSETGIGEAEIVRRSLNEYLNKIEEEKETKFKNKNSS